MILNFYEDDAQSWKVVLKDPLAAARQWYTKNVQTGLLELRPPTRTVGVPGLQVLVYVSKSAVTKLMKVSGMESVFTREFYENDADRAILVQAQSSS